MLRSNLLRKSKQISVNNFFPTIFSFFYDKTKKKHDNPDRLQIQYNATLRKWVFLHHHPS